MNQPTNQNQFFAIVAVEAAKQYEPIKAQIEANLEYQKATEDTKQGYINLTSLCYTKAFHDGISWFMKNVKPIQQEQAKPQSLILVP